MILPILYYGDPRLRMKCEPVEVIDESVLKLIADMIETLDALPGYGIAAPQLGSNLRIFISNVSSLDSEGFPVVGAPKVYINPVIKVLDETSWVDSEGCLSIPKIYEDVPRPYKISIEAMNERGKIFTEELKGWQARPILHENDHLNGVLFIDRIAPHRRQALQIQLKKIKKKYHPT